MYHHVFTAVSGDRLRLTQWAWISGHLFSSFAILPLSLYYLEGDNSQSGWRFESESGNTRLMCMSGLRFVFTSLLCSYTTEINKLKSMILIFHDIYISLSLYFLRIYLFYENINILVECCWVTALYWHYITIVYYNLHN